MKEYRVSKAKIKDLLDIEEINKYKNELLNPLKIEKPIKDLVLAVAYLYSEFTAGETYKAKKAEILIEM